jgi:hypothetical protein
VTLCREVLCEVLASVCFGGTGLLKVPHVLAFLPSVGNLVFLLFDGAATALLLSGQ